MERLKNHLPITNEMIEKWIEELPPEKRIENMQEEVSEPVPKSPGLWLGNLQDKKIPIPFNTKYKFLSTVNGLTEGNFNVIAGRTGKGKTDLLTSLIGDNLINGYLVGFCLSEGKLHEYKLQLQNLLYERTKKLKEVDKLMFQVIGFEANQIKVDSQYDYGFWVKSFYNLLRSHNIQIAYLDNLSTINFNNSNPEIESGFTEALVRGASENQICMTAAIHPVKSLHPHSEITKDQFRGNASHVNMATNVFALNNFDNINSSLRIIKILKSRYYGENVGKSFEVKFKKLKFRGFYHRDSLLTSIQAQKYIVDNFKRKPTARNYSNQ